MAFLVKLTIILSQEADNYKQTDTYARWGLGDLLKGISCAYSICEDVGVDFQTVSCEHPISDFYNMVAAVPKDFPAGRTFKTFQDREAMRAYVETLKTKDEDAAILSNGYGEWPERMSKASKAYMRHLLKLNGTWQNNLDKLGVSGTNYSVLHIRMGDDHLINQHSNIPLYVRFLLFYMSWKNVFLLTDSNVIKSYAKQRYSYKISPYDPKHLGLHKGENNIAGTIIEFNIMCSAKKIYSYSSYDWISSFAMAASKIYDVPIVNLKRFSFQYQLKMLARKVR